MKEYMILSIDGVTIQNTFEIFRIFSLEILFRKKIFAICCCKDEICVSYSNISESALFFIKFHFKISKFIIIFTESVSHDMKHPHNQNNFNGIRKFFLLFLQLWNKTEGEMMCYIKWIFGVCKHSDLISNKSG